MISPVPFRIDSAGSGLAALRYGEGEKVVIVFQPLAEERKGCVRPLHELGLACASAGHGMVLFDYAGTGESPGDFGDISWSALKTNCADAVLQAKELGAKEILFLGVRLGARLALETARDFPPERIVLWEPVTDGGKWLKEISRRSKFRLGNVEKSANDVDGYLFSETMVGDLNEAADFESPETETKIIAIAPGGKASKDAVMVAEKFSAAITPVEMEPFWLETDVVDAARLIAETLKAVME